MGDRAAANDGMAVITNSFTKSNGADPSFLTENHAISRKSFRRTFSNASRRGDKEPESNDMNILCDNRIAERSKRNAESTKTAQAVSADTLVSRRALCGRAVACALSVVCGSLSVANQYRDERSYQDHNEESWRTAWEESE